MKPLTRLLPFCVLLVVLFLGCGGGAERRHEGREAAQPEGWHRAETGSSAVPLSRPAGEGSRVAAGSSTTARGSVDRGQVAAGSESTPSIGFATGVPSDSTGVLLPREFDAGADPALVHGYLLYLPQGIESRSWPLIVYLHGRSLRGDNLSLLTRYGLPDRLQDDESFPFIVVAPQLPGDQSWTDTDRLTALVRDIAARYPVDRTRIYLIGYSMGAGGVWREAVAHPELFAAAAPAAAWTPEPSPQITAALSDLPIRIYHGTEDEVAPFARAEAMAEELERAGVDVTFSVYQGVDHGELTHIYKEDELYGWLLEHQR
ncbi:MAG TPA: dienelactone hydrolase family protein [Gemmatimonadota bacterium]|nr:dienelactone hydrolase family protein [Gemmatimonadota bacterium]